MKKIRVGILFGGKSAEHEVSLQSAKNIIDAIDQKKYDVLLIGIDKKGQWLLNKASTFLLNSNNPKLIALNQQGNHIAVALGNRQNQLVSLEPSGSSGNVDVVFPVLHGPFGEDGTVQGLLKLAGIPFVGASVLGSAVGMDKDVMKRLLRDAGVPVANFLTVHDSTKNDFSFLSIREKLGLPFFVKPANLGSSVGVSKISSESEFENARDHAFQFDRKILFEEAIDGREIEIAVLGNDNPIASVPGEIIPKHDFYSYEAKYIDENGAGLEVPAKVPEKMVKEFQSLAIKTFKVLECEGMA